MTDPVKKPVRLGKQYATAAVCGSLLLEWQDYADALQAKIDALMLEHCPNEMSPEQLAERGRHQRPVGNEEQRLRGALARGYCSPENEHKTVDPTLIEAMVREIVALSSPPLREAGAKAEVPEVWVLHNNRGLVKWYIPTFYPPHEPEIFTGRYNNAHPTEAPFRFVPLFKRGD